MESSDGTPEPIDAPDEEGSEPRATCLWCGAERPVDVAICPACEHTWIDATLDEAQAGLLDEQAAHQPVPAVRTPLLRRRWAPLAIALIAAGIYAVFFWGLWDGTDQEATTTSVAAATTRAPITASPTTSEAPTTTATTTTTTSSTTTTTTTTTTTLPPIELIEPGYSAGQLTLGAFALGPIRIGSIDEAVPGRLAATFGQPDGRFVVGENWGMCPGEEARVLEFGFLSVVLGDDPDGEAFVGYRMRQREDAADFADHPSASLRTISGLALDDPLSRARTLYANVITDELDDGTPIFLVLRSSDQRTLLWGELSDDTDPVVRSINSRRPCDGGPFGP